MNHFIRYLFFILVCRPLVFVVLGLNVRGYQWLTRFRPCIIVANHNSHLDAIVLMTILPLKLLRYIRPVASEEYFLRNPMLAWFAKRIIGIIPLSRNNPKKNCLASCGDALNSGNMLIFFPEGTRGEPEEIQLFKRGIEHLAKLHPDVPIIPVFMRGLGKALPKGGRIFVPYFCDIFVGEPLCWTANRGDFMATLNTRMKSLAEKGGSIPVWN